MDATATEEGKKTSILETPLGRREIPRRKSKPSSSGERHRRKSKVPLTLLASEKSLLDAGIFSVEEETG